MSYNPPPEPPQNQPPNQPQGQPQYGPPQGQPQYGPPQGQYGPPPQGQPPQQYQPQGQPPGMPPPPPGYNYGQQRQGIPPQVNVVSILMFVAGGFAILGGLLLFALGSLGAIFALVGVILLIVGGAEIWVGVALRQLKEWARMAALVLAGVSAVFNLISMIKGGYGSIISLVIDLVIIYLLMQKPVVDTFARSAR